MTACDGWGVALGSTACSATSAEPRCARSTSSAWSVAPACGSRQGSWPSLRRRRRRGDRPAAGTRRHRRATRCSTRPPASSWPSRHLRRCRLPTRTPRTCSRPSGRRWVAAGSGRRTCRRRARGGGTTRPTPGRCGPARRATDYADEPAPATTMQPPYRSEYDGGSYDATGRVPATYTPWEVAPWEQAEGAAARPRAVPRQAAAGDLRAGGRRRGRRHGRPTSSTSRRPGRPLDGAWKLNDFGTNLTVAGVLTALTMVLGAIAWCVGYRWGAGLAGGAGAGLAGWVAIALGQAEVVVSTGRRHAPRATRAVTREVGYWALVAAGGLGLVVLIVSLAAHGRRRAGRPRPVGRRPRGDGDDRRRDRPADPGRRRRHRPQLVEPARAPTCRRRGSPPASCSSDCCCCAACSASCSSAATASGWRSAARSAPAGWCSPRRPSRPTGRSGWPSGNPDDVDRSSKPHIVTIVGVGLMLFFGLVATAMALIDDR